MIMINNSELVKLRLSMLALEINRWQVEKTTTPDIVMLLGRRVLPYRAEFPVADTICDIINMLDELSVGKNPKKILNHIYSILHKTQKTLAVSEYAKFVVFWHNRYSNDVHADIFEIDFLSELFIDIQQIMYGGIYIGGRQVYRNKFVEADKSSWMLLYHFWMSALGYSYVISLSEGQTVSDEFRKYISSGLLTKNKEYCMDVMKSLVQQFEDNNLIQVFIAEPDGPEILFRKSKTALIHRCIKQLQNSPDPKHDAIEKISRLEKNFLKDPYKWSEENLRILLTALNGVLGQTIRYMQMNAQKTR